MGRKSLFILLGVLFGFSPLWVQSQTLPSPTTQPSSTTKPSPADSGWYVLKEKSFPFYKVQILTKDNRAMPLGIEGTKAVITNQKGRVMAEVRGLVIEPDPRETIEGWVPGTLLDVDKDGLEDLVLRSYTGGAHCCYSYQIFSLGKSFKKLGDLKLLDCGEKIKLQDLNGDGIPEIVSCNASFTYFKDIPYSDSPFPPQVFGLENGKYARQDKTYVKVFDEDIAAQKKALQDRGYNDGDALQIVLDYFLSGREAEGWTQFDLLLNSAKKESIRSELIDRWQKYSGVSPESQAAESGPAQSRPAQSQPSLYKLP